MLRQQWISFNLFLECAHTVPECNFPRLLLEQTLLQNACHEETGTGNFGAEQLIKLFFLVGHTVRRIMVPEWYSTNLNFSQCKSMKPALFHRHYHHRHYIVEHRARVWRAPCRFTAARFHVSQLQTRRDGINTFNEFDLG